MRVQVFYFNAGGGHASAKDALVQYYAKYRPEWEVIPVNLTPVLETLDPVSVVTRKVTEYPELVTLLTSLMPRTDFRHTTLEEIYNARIKRGETKGLLKQLRALQAAIAVMAPLMEKKIQAHFQSTPAPDLVISLIPNFDSVLFRGLKAAHPQVPMVTVMTDIADCPPNFWMFPPEPNLPGPPLSLVCGSEMAYQQAVATGFYTPETLHQVSGMILNPGFYEPITKPLTHAELGLDPAKPTAIIMFGGNGATISKDIAAWLAETGVQSIVMCGTNKDLHQSLQGMPSCYAAQKVGDVYRYMALGNLFIGKPGPGSMSEAIKMGLPIITANADVMPQEQPNLTWIEENDLGLIIPAFTKEHVTVASQHILQNAATYRANIAALPPNNALAELTVIFENLVENAPNLSTTNMVNFSRTQLTQRIVQLGRRLVS